MMTPAAAVVLVVFRNRPEVAHDRSPVIGGLFAEGLGKSERRGKSTSE
jgi:hypothetical protein